LTRNKSLGELQGFCSLCDSEGGALVAIILGSMYKISVQKIDNSLSMGSKAKFLSLMAGTFNDQEDRDCIGNKITMVDLW
jgi:hypothetical protein